MKNKTEIFRKDIEFVSGGVDCFCFLKGFLIASSEVSNENDCMRWCCFEATVNVDRWGLGASSEEAKIKARDCLFDSSQLLRETPFNPVA